MSVTNQSTWRVISAEFNLKVLRLCTLEFRLHDAQALYTPLRCYRSYTHL
jgi:hypothetical protein